MIRASRQEGESVHTEPGQTASEASRPQCSRRQQPFLVGKPRGEPASISTEVILCLERGDEAGIKSVANAFPCPTLPSAPEESQPASGPDRRVLWSANGRSGNGVRWCWTASRTRRVWRHWCHCCETRRPMSGFGPFTRSPATIARATSPEPPAGRRTSFRHPPLQLLEEVLDEDKAHVVGSGAHRSSQHESLIIRSDVIEGVQCIARVVPERDRE